MGLNHTGTKLLLYARSCGVDFERTVMIGRQFLYLDQHTLEANLREFGMNPAHAADMLARDNGYAEYFLRSLGAREVDSIDASTYESASIIHDMNLPLAEKYKNTFDVVLDGGSLEHVFNFPIAIKNCMEMVKLHGYFLGISPANNFCGHGFYQFSPELYFRVFAPENGFEMERLVFFVDDSSRAGWYEVKDPKEVKARVMLCNSTPSYLFVMAKKTSDQKVFARNPQQSDYENIAWKRKPEEGGQTAPLIAGKVRDRIMSRVSHYSRKVAVLFKETGAANASFFQRIR
jgi:hypothetical protein